MSRIKFKSEKDFIVLRAGIDAGQVVIEVENYPQPFDRLEMILDDDEAERLIEVLQQREQTKTHRKAS